MRVLVTGATGFVGGRLVPALSRRGHDVVALVRDPTSYDPPQGVEVRTGDLLDPASLEGVFSDIDAAYYLVHSMKSGADFAERDRRAASNFSDAASSANVDRVVYLGGLGETGDVLSEHLRSRREVEKTLSEGSYALTTLRAAIIIGHGSAGFTVIRQLGSRLPVMLTPRWVRVACQPIAIDDVIAYLVGVLDVPETAGEMFEIGGPEVLTYGEMIKRTAARLGKRPIIIPVPVLSIRLSVLWIDLVTDVPREIAHPLIAGLKNPVVVTDHRIEDLVPVELTPFDVAVDRALARRRGGRRPVTPVTNPTSSDPT